MTSRELVLKIAKLADDKKARDIALLNVEGLTIVADYFLVCSASSTTLVRSIADNIEDGMAKEEVYPKHREGYDTSRWVLLDYGDVVVHVFLNEEREFYNLEGLWADAPVESYGGEE